MHGGAGELTSGGSQEHVLPEDIVQQLVIRDDVSRIAEISLGLGVWCPPDYQAFRPKCGRCSGPCGPEKLEGKPPLLSSQRFLRQVQLLFNPFQGWYRGPRARGALRASALLLGRRLRGATHREVVWAAAMLADVLAAVRAFLVVDRLLAAGSVLPASP